MSVRAPRVRLACARLGARGQGRHQRRRQRREEGGRGVDEEHLSFVLGDADVLLLAALDEGGLGDDVVDDVLGRALGGPVAALALSGREGVRERTASTRHWRRAWWAGGGGTRALEQMKETTHDAKILHAPSSLLRRLVRGARGRRPDIEL